MCWWKLNNPLGMFLCYTESHQPGHIVLFQNRMFCCLDRILKHQMWTANVKECFECIAVISEIKWIQNALEVGFYISHYFYRFYRYSSRWRQVIWVITDSFTQPICSKLRNEPVKTVYEWFTQSFAQLIHSKMQIHSGSIHSSKYACFHNIL